MFEPDFLAFLDPLGGLFVLVNPSLGEGSGPEQEMKVGAGSAPCVLELHVV